MPPFTNEADVRAFLATVMDTIKQDGNPEVLNHYRSLFRKQVPFFMRSYVSAYLIQQALEGLGKGRRPFKNRRGLSEAQKTPRNGAGFEPEQKKQNIPEEESAHIFISIGRNRRVFPREILSLILSETDVKKEDIGLIRILDNYSFVQVRKEWAETIINTLNGKIFKGRPLMVNHARSRTEENQQYDTPKYDEDEQDETLDKDLYKDENSNDSNSVKDLED